MATEYVLTLEGQPYFNSHTKRNFNVFYTIPEQNITEDTGILLLIAGFGGDAGSKVYSKMRREFADSKNLLVIQCDYFGYQFMGNEAEKKTHAQMSRMSDHIKHMAENGQPVDSFMQETIVFEETPDSFCELGLFQALDNLKAIKEILNMLSVQNISFDHNRIIAYGFSHGGYLALFCNALMPNLFSAIIDNSGWVYPVYLYKPRIRSFNWNNPNTDNTCSVFLHLKYQGTEWIDDLDIYNLNRLYAKFKNHARIISFHGESDSLVSPAEKEHFLRRVANAKFYVIEKKHLDHEIFKNTKHGMGSNFLKLFYYAADTEPLDRIKKEAVQSSFLCTPRNFHSRKYEYKISEDIEITRQKTESMTNR